MRHRVSGTKLGRTTSHRRAMLRNLSNSLIEHERVITTVQKAKAVKPIVERLVTSAKSDSLHHRRRAFAQLRDPASVEKLFDTLGPRFRDRPGGYCRILKLVKPRLGDNGQRALIEFVERGVEDEDEVEAGDEVEVEAEPTA